MMNREPRRRARAISTSWFDGRAPKLVCPALVLGPGTVRAEGATIGWWPSPDLVDGFVHGPASGPDAHVVIGPGTTANNGTKVLAAGPGIDVGCDVLIGRNTEIYDSDR